MEVTELTIWIARLCVLGLMGILLLSLVVALFADARAAGTARPAIPAPAPAPVAVPTAPAARPQASTAARRLQVSAGSLPTTGREYQLFGPLEIGRENTCDIAIPSRIVSKRHARIFPQDGQWLVEDLGSTNGTLINGQPLAGPHPLIPGDRLMVGDTEFVVN